MRIPRAWLESLGPSGEVWIEVFEPKPVAVEDTAYIEVRNPVGDIDRLVLVGDADRRQSAFDAWVGSLAVERLECSIHLASGGGIVGLVLNPEFVIKLSRLTLDACDSGAHHG